MKKMRNQTGIPRILGQMERGPDGFWTLLEPEYEGAMMFCRKLMGDRDNGDDLYQDALVDAYAGFAGLKNRDAFRPWLYRVIINTFRATIRRPWWKHRVRQPADRPFEPEGNSPLDRHTARRWLTRAFQAVSPAEQALVTLHELEGWPVDELAAVYQKSPGAIKASLFRARQKMKNKLDRILRAAERSAGTSTSAKEDIPCVAAKSGAD
jgi:RNA polymerase sigma-70 factor (ECF subfamily)